jgi:hypothetical protein
VRLVFLLPSVCAIKPSNFSDEKHAVWSGYHLYTIALSFTGGMEKEEACKSSLTMKPRHKMRAPTDLAFRRRTWSPRQLLPPTVANSCYVIPHLLPSQPLLYWFFFLLPPRRIRVRFCLRIPRKFQLNKKHVIGWRRGLMLMRWRRGLMLMRWRLSPPSLRPPRSATPPSYHLSWMHH